MRMVTLQVPLGELDDLRVARMLKNMNATQVLRWEAPLGSTATVKVEINGPLGMQLGAHHLQAAIEMLGITLRGMGAADGHHTYELFVHPPPHPGAPTEWYSGGCSCGWRGPKTNSKDLAHDDWHRHVAPPAAPAAVGT